MIVPLALMFNLYCLRHAPIVSFRSMVACERAGTILPYNEPSARRERERK